MTANRIIRCLVIIVFTTEFLIHATKSRNKSIPLHKAGLDSSTISKTGNQLCDRTGSGLFQNLDPIDDSQRVSALVMLAQQNVPNKIRIPPELQQIIHQYFDYNEIRTVFKILTSTKDRKGVLGFENYHKMHQEHPCKLAKILYLSGETMVFRRGAFGFSDQQRFIVSIDWTPYIAMQWRGHSRHDPTTINWNAIGQLKHLQYLRLAALRLNVSMQDIKSLPDSLRSLNIAGCVWTEPEGDVDISLFPSGLRVFIGFACEGMTGILKLAAPHSNLTTLRLERTEIRDVSGIHALPRKFKSLYLSGARLNLSQSYIAFFREKGLWKSP